MYFDESNTKEAKGWSREEALIFPFPLFSCMSSIRGRCGGTA